jgi:hypothetical protein
MDHMQQQPSKVTMSGGKSFETPMSLDLTAMISKSNSGIRSAFEKARNEPSPTEQMD